MTQIDGTLEIDHDRGVIWFHANEVSKYGTITVFRMCKLPRPIPELGNGLMLDVTHLHGTSWSKPYLVQYYLSGDMEYSFKSIEAKSYEEAVQKLLEIHFDAKIM
jgi:hypothetical protein